LPDERKTSVSARANRAPTPSPTARNRVRQDVTIGEPPILEADAPMFAGGHGAVSDSEFKITPLESVEDAQPSIRG
jgi:hypothetical protein